MNETEKFIKFRDEFSTDIEKISEQLEISAWNFYINSDEENKKNYEKAQADYTKLFSNRNIYEKFSDIDKNALPYHEQKQLKNLLKNFEIRINSGELYKLIEKKENEISQKYNSYIPQIDGKETSKTEISKILQSETDENVRKKAYEALIKGGDIISDDLTELIKLRNEFAHTRGYKNFFDYQLKEEFEVDSEFLNKLINEVYDGVKRKISEILNEDYDKLKKAFNTDNLEGYHYGLLTDSDPSKEINEILEKYNTEDISKNAYKGMGYNLEQFISEGKLTLDLYPRKGKNTHGFCFCISAGQDSRILANLRNDTGSLDTLLHELGHCVYDLGISGELTVLDRKPSSSAFTEAIAMMMGDLPKKENILKNIIPAELLQKFKNTLIKDEINFISKSLLIIDFEKELYYNPEINCPKLWADLRKKYRNQNHKENNEWAVIPHYLSHPAYYQNYFRANLMKVQIYNHLHSVLGNITENTNTANYLNNKIFSQGASIEEYDLIKQLTGNDFSSGDFINSV